MKKIRFFIFILNFYSLSALASYECLLKLAHTGDLQKTIGQKTLVIEQGRLQSGSMGTLFVEKNKTSLEIHSFFNGLKGEEEATFSIIRKKKERFVTISENFSIRGKDEITGWFDAYKLDMSCKVGET